MFDSRRYRRYRLREARYLAIPLEIIVFGAWFTGALPPLLAVVYLIILGAWFVLG